MIYNKVLCSFCGKKFLRYKGKVNEAKKLGWSQYCSPRCQFTARLSGEYKICQTCNKKVWRTPKETKNSLTNRFFCNTSCAAIFNNRIRSEALPKKFCKNPNCNKQIPRDQTYCSWSCAGSSRKRTIRSLKLEVLGKIRKFYKQNNRIPVKKEMYGAYGKARDVFGTWNKAIEAAGYKPNPVMFANRCLASDGHWCDSLAEKIIDEWLHSKGIDHKRSVPYPKINKMTCDFVVGKYFIEFFGLEGEVERYTKHANLKRRLSKKYGLNLVEIKPTDVFPKNRLDQVLNFLL